MKLIGMLDSPYVRRVAISLKLLGVEFEHQSVSVFRHFDKFREINPVVKAPTLITDDGQTIMESSVILDYVMAVNGGGATLLPTDPAKRLRASRRIGLSLVASEKTVQIVYERNLRPAEKQFEPWIDRVRGQMLTAYRELEDELADEPFAADEAKFGLAGVTVAVGWHFTQMVLPEIVVAAEFPKLHAFSTFAETQPTFVGTPAE